MTSIIPGIRLYLIRVVKNISAYVTKFIISLTHVGFDFELV